MRVLRRRETAVHLVTLLEEMPVQETVDGVAELRAADLPVGRDRRQHGPARRCSTRRDLSRGRRGDLAGDGDRRALKRGRARGPRGAGRRRRSLDEAAEHARAGRRWSGSERAGSASSGVPVATSSPLLRRRHRPRRPVRARAATCGRSGARMSASRRSTGTVSTMHGGPARSTSTRCSTTRRPGSSSAAAPAASARPRPPPRSALRAAERGPRRRRAHHRPGPAAGPVDGPDRARQHPAPGRGHRAAAASCTR